MCFKMASWVKKMASVHDSPLWYAVWDGCGNPLLCLVSCMHMHKFKRIELWTRNDRPQPSQQIAAGLRVYVQWRRLCSILSDYRNRYDREQAGYLTSCFTRSSVARLAWPASAKRFAPWCLECISMTTFVHMVLLFWPILSIQRVHILCSPGNDTDYIRQIIVWKILLIVCSVIKLSYY